MQITSWTIEVMKTKRIGKRGTVESGDVVLKKVDRKNLLFGTNHFRPRLNAIKLPSLLLLIGVFFYQRFRPLLLLYKLSQQLALDEKRNR